MIALILSVFLSISASADTTAKSGLAITETYGFFPHQIQSLFPLVDKTINQGESHLRVQVATYSRGGSTDVSNLVDILFTTYNYSEMKSASSNHIVDSVHKVLKVERISAGIYQIIAEKWIFSDEEPNEKLHGLQKVRYQINATDLLVDVQNLNDVEEFNEKWSLKPILIEKEILK